MRIAAGPLRTSAFWLSTICMAAAAADPQDYHKKWYTPSTASTFNDVVRSEKQTIELFYDREGSIYPSAQIAINTDAFIRGFEDRNDAATVRGHFAREAKQSPEIVESLAVDAAVSTSQRLLSTWSDANWEIIQAGYRVRYSKRILEVSNGNAIIFLVHGYRNTYEEAREWFLPLEAMVRSHDPSATVVHVYWDGLSGWRFLDLWKKAQYNMADIGLEFRRLLNEFPEDSKIRIISHSTGAPLIANALGDASDAFRQNSDPMREGDCYFLRASGSDCAPFDVGSYRVKRKKHLRFGAIAPAATLDTFNRYQPDRDIVPERVSMALNRLDAATSKYFLNCEFLGSSCMAVEPQRTCEILTEKFPEPQTDVGVFDFALSKVGTPPAFKLWRQHSVMGYAKNERWNPFLRHLLTDQQLVTDTKELCSIDSPG